MQDVVIDTTKCSRGFCKQGNFILDIVHVLNIHDWFSERDVKLLVKL